MVDAEAYMTVRIAGTAANLEGIRSIPDVADYIDSLVLTIEQIDGFEQSPDFLARTKKTSFTNQKTTVLPPEFPDGD